MNNDQQTNEHLIEIIENYLMEKDEQRLVETPLTNETENYSTKEQIVDADNDDIIIFRNYGQTYTRNFGKYRVFKFKGNEPNVAIGPHWPLFLITYIILAFSGYKLIEYSFLNFNTIFCFFSIFITTFLLISFMATALLNPGIASAQYEILNEEEVLDLKRYCKPCQILRQKGTIHCIDCDVCIKEYDHHCPWTGKCIGHGNLFIFYVFIISFMTFIIYSFLVLFSPA